MGRRLQRLAAESAKFIAVGGVATLIALLLFNLLVHGFWAFRRFVFLSVRRVEHRQSVS